MKLRIAANIAVVFNTLLLAALPAHAEKAPLLNISQLQQQGSKALQQGDTRQAIQLFAEAAARQPRDATAQTLLAFAYHLQGQQDPAALDMALAGYDIAINAESGQYLPLALAGLASYQQARYQNALDYFSRALLLRPNDAPLLHGLAAAAYMTGDSSLACIASDTALRITTQASAELLQLAIYANAANRNNSSAEHWLQQLQQHYPQLYEQTRNRMQQLIQTSAIDNRQPQWLDTAGTAQNQPPVDSNTLNATAVVDNKQISLDVAIVLSQNTQREHTGINLMDGLNLQYGYARDTTHTVTRTLGEPISKSFQRVITKSISIPQLNYNMNLFNRNGQFYSVVARPQLTAFQGEQSEFFVGRTINVSVGGINLGSLDQIDVGIELRVTPIEITPERTLVRVEASRSFLTSDIPSSFKENLTTFRQRVAATAEIRFGETLLLSGLNETVSDHTYSKTPILGSIPILKTFFHEKNGTERQDSVMVLVTPSLPTALSGRPWARSEHVQRLTELWNTIIDPMTNAEATRQRLQKALSFSRMIKQDARISNLNTPLNIRHVLNQLIVPPSEAPQQNNITAL